MDELCGHGRAVWPWASCVAVGKLCDKLYTASELYAIGELCGSGELCDGGQAMWRCLGVAWHPTQCWRRCHSSPP
jgi:hypothetical protein